jgi:hypothetical protein
VLALVTVLKCCDLADRQAAAMAGRALDWKYAIGAELDDPGFDFMVLSKFRARLAEHGLERVVFDRLLAYCRDEGLVAAGSRQRTDRPTTPACSMPPTSSSATPSFWSGTT